MRDIDAMVKEIMEFQRHCRFIRIKAAALRMQLNSSRQRNPDYSLMTF